MLSIFVSCLKNDIRSLMRARAQWLQPVFFFILFVSLFGIGLGFDNALLISVAPAVIWVTFLLTTLFTVESLFRTDCDEGILEQLLLSPQPLWWLMLAKSIAFWLASCLPVLLVIPFLGLSMQLSFAQNSVLVLSILVGSPALSLLAVLGAALTIALPRAGIFLGLILLPLYVPILILGESTVVMLLSSEWPMFQFALLAAISVLAITFVPHATAAALRAAMD